MTSYKAALLEILKNKYLPFILGIPLFFCLHHYEGIVWDNVLYLLQVVHSFDPNRFLNDPPFMFGNQDSFGFFTPLYKFFLDFFGVAAGSKFFCFINHFLFAVVLVYLIDCLCKKEQVQLCRLPLTILFLFATAAFMPNMNLLFVGYVQEYDCSRMTSTIAGVLGIALLIKEKKWLSIIFILLGTVIHPLTAGWGIPIWLFVYYPKMILPVVLLSAFAPLSVVLHKVPFDFFPDDWMIKPLFHRPHLNDVFRSLSEIVFFGCFGCSVLRRQNTLISKALAIVLGIALYWNVWGGLGGHILFYQLQTWRVEWLAQTLAFPVFSIMFLKMAVNYKMDYGSWSFISFSSSTKNASFLIIGAVVLAQWHSVTFAVIATLMFFGKIFSRQHYKWMCLCLCFSISVLLSLYQNVNDLALQGTFKIPSVMNDFILNSVINNSILQVSFLLCLFLLTECILLRMWIPGALLVVYIIFPQIVFLPPLATIFFYKKEFSDCSKFWKLFAGISLIVLMDALLYSNTRGGLVLSGIPQVSEKLGLVFLFVFFAIIYCLLAKNSWKIAPKICIVVSVGLLVAFGMHSWDKRAENSVVIERNLDEFYSKTIFPEIENRGRIFFHVNGDITHVPRLQFLSGAYLSFNSHIGEIFFKDQFVETTKRENFLYYKEQRGIATEKYEFRAFVLNSLSNRDTLIDRMNFLCSIDEIDYVISDEEHLMKKRIDSHLMKNNQMLYLYKCE